MASTSPNDAGGSSDGPNKKSRLVQLIELPDSLDDAVVQPSSALAPQQADETQLQLGTLALSSGDDPAPPDLAAAAGAAKAQIPEVTATDTLMATDIKTVVEFAAGTGAAPLVPTPSAAPANDLGPLTGKLEAAVAMPLDEPLGTTSYQRETSLEPAPSDPGVCVSCDIAAGSSALDGLGGEEGEGEVASRRTGSASLAGGNGTGGGCAGGYEVFVGGLAPDANEEEVRKELQALSGAAVLSVRLQLTRGTSICKGYGFVTFADEAAAQRAVSAVAAGAQLCGRRVGLHASRRPFCAVLAAAQAAGAQPALQLSPDPAASINSLLGELRTHHDRRAAVAAALQVVQRGAKRSLPASAPTTALPSTPADTGGTTTPQAASAPVPQRTVVSGGKRQATGATVGAMSASTPAAQPEALGPAAAQDVAEPADGVKRAPATAAGPAAAPAKVADAPKAKSAAGKDGASKAAAGSATVAAAGTTNGKKDEKSGGGAGGMSADLIASLAAYPKISKLLNSLKGITRVPKTPLMVLHEYATKMSYEVTYQETSDGPAGPYTVESRLIAGGQNGNTIITASGKARTKKDAKQVSAAACLEKLLDSHRGISPQDLLPAPKPPVGSAAAPTPTVGGGRSGKAGHDKGGAGYNAAGGGRRGPPGSRHSSGPPPGALPPPPHHHNPHHHHHHRDALNRAGPPPPSLQIMLPPPPPPPPPHLHRGVHNSGPGGPPYGGSGAGGGQLGPIGRGSFGNGSGAGGAYSAVQPGLLPAGGAAGGLGHTSGGPGSVGAGPYGGAIDGHGSVGRGPRSGTEPYGVPGYSGGGGGGGEGGRGGSMVQLGLSGGKGGLSASASGAPLGGLYGREGARDGSAFGQDSYGGVSSYDPAAGQKRNYSTAMQAPGAGAGGGMLGGVGGGAGDQGPFAGQAGVGGRDGLGMGFSSGMGGLQRALPQPAQPQAQFLGQAQAQGIAGAFGQQAQIGQPVFPASQAQQGAYTQPLFGQSQQQPQAQLMQQPQQQQQSSLGTIAAAAAPSLPQAFGGYGQAHLQQQQQSLQKQQQLVFSQQGLAGGSGLGGSAALYGGSQNVQLQPAQPQPLFTQSQSQSQQPVLGQSNMYGLASISQPQGAQLQPQQQYGTGGMYGGALQPQQGSMFGGGSGGPIQQQQLQQPESQSYGLSGSSGLQAFGARPGGGGLWN